MKTVYNFLLNAAILLIFFPLSCVITVFMLFFGSSLGDANNQYKRIGDTKYYVMRDYIGDTGPFLYYRTDKITFEDVQTQSFVEDVYWNDDYILLVCTDLDFAKGQHYYVLRQKPDFRRKGSPWNMREYTSIDKYEKAKDSLGLDETKMQHTDGNIPWRITIFDQI